MGTLNTLVFVIAMASVCGQPASVGPIGHQGIAYSGVMKPVGETHPQFLSEGAPAFDGSVVVTVTMDAVSDTNTTLALSHPGANGPSTVVVPAGQLTVNFTLSPTGGSTSSNLTVSANGTSITNTVIFVEN